jgi:hypothetical protein
MAKKPLPSVELNYPAQYIFSCMANRFALQREDGFILAQFGLVGKSGLLIDQYACIFPDHTLKAQRENLVQYSDKLGPQKKEPVAWTPQARAPSEMTIPVVDFLHVSHWEENGAEICFWNFAQGHLSDVTRSGSKQPLTPFGMAMLRCDIDLQRAFLIALYEEKA